MFITRRFSWVLVVLVFLAAPVAACGKSGGSDDGVASVDGASDDGGSSDDDSGSGSGSDNPRSNEEFQDAALEYAQCMREHGVDMPDPEFEGEGGVLMRMPEGADRDEVEAAQEECQPIMDEAVPEGEPMDPEEQAEMQDQLLEVAQCMRERGHDVPDPEVDENGRVTFGAGPGGGPGGGGEAPEPDEEFDQDMEECQEEAGMEMPRSRRGGGGGVSDGAGGDA
jgi:hypothetical protein